MGAKILGNLIKNLNFADQWSPIFTEGKKQYGREFLVMLATDPMSMRKPENLPSMDIIKDAPNQDRNRGNFDILNLLLPKINLQGVS